MNEDTWRDSYDHWLTTDPRDADPPDVDDLETVVCGTCGTEFDAEGYCPVCQPDNHSESERSEDGEL